MTIKVSGKITERMMGCNMKVIRVSTTIGTLPICKSCVKHRQYTAKQQWKP